MFDGITSIFRGKDKSQISSRAPFGKNRTPLWLLKFTFRSVYCKDFYRQLRLNTLAELTFAETISTLMDQAAETNESVYWHILKIMADDLTRGFSLTETLAQWCPASDLLLISSGGDRPKLMAEALARVLRMQAGRSEMIVALMMTMLDPAVVILATYAMTIWMATSFVNEILAAAQHINPDELTGLARQLLILGEYCQGWRVLVPPALFYLIVWGVIWSMPRWTGRARKYFDNIPPWSIYRAIQGAGWMQGFAMLAEQKVVYSKILAETARIGTPWLSERCLAALRLMNRSGLPIGDALWKTGYNFPNKRIALNLKFMGTRPGFSDVMTQISTEWYQSLINNMKMTSNLMAIFSLLISTAALAWVTQASSDLQNQVAALLRSHMY